MKRPDYNSPLNLTEKYKSRISLIVSVVTLLVLCLLLGQLDRILIQGPLKKEQEKQQQEEEQKALAEATPDVYTANFLAVGDNRFSNALISSGYAEEQNTYNFDEVYAQVKAEVSAADFAIINQETIFTENSDSYSGEDTFATPVEVGDALVSTGFDGIASASNHTDDFGASMITETLEYWKTYPNVKVLGIHPSEAEAGTITIVDVNQIKVALLDYTSSTYTYQLDEENAYMVDSLTQEKVAADIASAKSASDCIIVIANWGEENTPEVGEEQKEWANFLLSQGVQVTIGMNPREIQPFETLTDANGNSMLVYYSLGNFVSTQSEIPRLLGGMAKFTIEKTVPKDTTQAPTVQISASELLPTVMHYNHDESIYQVYPLSAYTEELADSHSIHDMTEETFSLSSLQSLFAERTAGPVLSQNPVTPSSAPEEASDQLEADDATTEHEQTDSALTDENQTDENTTDEAF